MRFIDGGDWCAMTGTDPRRRARAGYTCAYFLYSECVLMGLQSLNTGFVRVEGWIAAHPYMTVLAILWCRCHDTAAPACLGTIP